MAETDYPLLVFPKPVSVERAGRSRGGGKIRVPSASHQARRLAPQFQRLQEAMDNQRLAFQDNPLGLQPEQVLVLETVGPIQDFIQAVEKIPGLEWLGEYELDDIAPSHGFEDSKNAEKTLKGRLFLVMTDQRALSQMRNLFESWERNPETSFPDRLAPLKRAFEHLHTIRSWGVEDRIRDTGLLEDWRERLEHEQDDVPFEAEFWFRRSTARREQAESVLGELIASGEGQILQRCVIPEIGYHAILGRMPRAQVQAIMDDPEAFRDIRMLQCEDLMHARPVGQCAVPATGDGETEPLTDEEINRLIPPSEPLDGSSLIALFDGVPLTGHRLLHNRLDVDDPDMYEDAYQARERVHGTGMASLICHGDLNRRDVATDRPIYVRPILQPRRGFGGQFQEAIPDNVLPVDLIHRVVRRLFEWENSDPPAAPEVQIVNLSIGDPSRPLFREMSAWARLLDWLACKYNILFIVSAGNHVHDLELAIPRPGLNALSADQRERVVIEALAADTRNRRLLSPAETLNGLTIGASHEDAAPPPMGTHPPIEPFVHRGLPNVGSAHGPGYRRSIKPDVLLPGGRQLMSERLGTGHVNATLQQHSSVSPPGQRVAAPGTAGQLDRTCYMRGTSNSAALASHWAGALLQLVHELRIQHGHRLTAEYDVVLTKALLVHGAGWDSAQEHYESVLKNQQNGRYFKEYLSRFLGYGSANIARVMTCTDERVTVLGFGELDDGEGAEFAFPLPPSLSSVNERRRLTVTLSWLSPTNTSRQSYRIAHLWFDPSNAIAPKRQFADHRAVQRGTLQHEVLEGDSATVFQDGDSIAIKVNCRAEAADIPEPVRYGLAVTLEVPEGVAARLFTIPIYQEVRDRIATRVQVEGRTS